MEGLVRMWTTRWPAVVFRHLGFGVVAAARLAHRVMASEVGSCARASEEWTVALSGHLRRHWVCAD